MAKKIKKITVTFPPYCNYHFQRDNGRKCNSSFCHCTVRSTKNKTRNTCPQAFSHMGYKSILDHIQYMLMCSCLTYRSQCTSKAVHLNQSQALGGIVSELSLSTRTKGRRPRPGKKTCSVTPHCHSEGWQQLQEHYTHTHTDRIKFTAELLGNHYIWFCWLKSCQYIYTAHTNTTKIFCFTLYQVS